MLNLKKTAVAVLAFGSSAVFAGTMGPVCTPGNVTVPCASTAWDFGAQALYLKPSYAGFGYYGSTVNNAGTVETYRKTPNDWGWGFQIEGSYHFNTGNDLNLNWYHLDNTPTNTFAGPVTIGTSVLSDTFTGVTASAQTRWDQVNLEFGQLSHFGEWKNIRFHGGVQYSRVQANPTVSATTAVGDNVIPAGVLLTAESNNKYNGFGARVGADYIYNWGNGLAMYAKGASALLVGSQSFNNTISVAGVVPSPVYTVTGSTTQVVPELEAKLGATYTYAMAQGDLSADVGWLWVNYFDALATGVPSTVAAGATKGTNFALQGLYFGLKWVGNVA